MKNPSEHPIRLPVLLGALAAMAYIASAWCATLEQTLYEALRNHQESLDVREFNAGVDEVRTTFRDLQYEHPELIAVEQFSYSYSTAGMVFTIFPKYALTPEQTDELLTKMYAVADRILQNTDGMDDLTVALHCLDAVVLHVAYTTASDFDAQEEFPGHLVHTAAGALVFGKAVCEGYAHAYQLLLNRKGIPNRLIASTAMSHAWNAVKINDLWYHVDPTYADSNCAGYLDFSQEPPAETNYPYSDFPARVAHEFFLRDDAGLNEKRPHHGWSPALDELGTTASDPTDAFWLTKAKSAKGTICIHKNCYYYIDYQEDKCILNKAVGNVVPVPLHAWKTRWPVWNNPSAYWSGAFSGVVAVDDLLVFNDTTTLYGYDLVDGEAFVIAKFDATALNGYIYGIWKDLDGRILAHVAQSPNYRGYVTELAPLKEFLDNFLRLQENGYRMASQMREHAQPIGDATAPTHAAFAPWLRHFFATTQVSANHALTLEIPPRTDAEGTLTLELFAEDDTELAAPLASVTGALANGLKLQYCPADFAARKLLLRATGDGQSAVHEIQLAVSEDVVREYLTFTAAPQVNDSEWRMLAIPANFTILEQPETLPANLFTYDPTRHTWVAPAKLAAGCAYWVKGADTAVTLLCSHEPTTQAFAPGWNLVAWTDDMPYQPFLWDGNAFVPLEDYPAYGTPVLIYRQEKP